MGWRERKGRGGNEMGWRERKGREGMERGGRARLGYLIIQFVQGPPSYVTEHLTNFPIVVYLFHHQAISFVFDQRTSGLCCHIQMNVHSCVFVVVTTMILYGNSCVN